jgi:hypothetical protein
MAPALRMTRSIKESKAADLHEESFTNGFLLELQIFFTF